MTTEIERNANLAYAAVAGYNHDCNYCTQDGVICDDMYEELSGVEFPGFVTLGAGGSRVALLKDGFVYKVEYTPAMGYKYWEHRITTLVNQSELENYIKFLDVELPDNWRIPVTDVVWIADQPVLVMEHIDGDTGNWDYEYSPEHNAAIKATGLCDLYCDNVILSGDHWYVVDFAQ